MQGLPRLCPPGRACAHGRSPPTRSSTQSHAHTLDLKTSWCTSNAACMPRNARAVHVRRVMRPPHGLRPLQVLPVNLVPLPCRTGVTTCHCQKQSPKGMRVTRHLSHQQAASADVAPPEPAAKALFPTSLGGVGAAAIRQRHSNSSGPQQRRRARRCAPTRAGRRSLVFRPPTSLQPSPKPEFPTRPVVRHPHAHPQHHPLRRLDRWTPPPRSYLPPDLRQPPHHTQQETRAALHAR